MAETKIPEEIKQYRPGPCTEIKLINGHYYVYMYQSIWLPSGRWGKRPGKALEPSYLVLALSQTGITTCTKGPSPRTK